MFFSKNDSQNPSSNQNLPWARSGLSFGPHSLHNTTRGCPKLFQGVCVHHRRRGAVNSPGWKSDICQIWDLDLQDLKNDRLSDRRLHCSPPPVMDRHSRKWLRAIPSVVVGATRAKRVRKTSAQRMSYRKMNFEIRFLKKTCIFWWFQNLDFMIWGGQVGRKKIDLNFRVLWPSNSLEMNL